MLRSIGNTQVLFIKESGLMFRTFAQFLVQMNFSGGPGGVQNAFGNSGGLGWRGVYFSFKKWKFQRGRVVLSETLSVLGGMDIF